MRKQTQCKYDIAQSHMVKRTDRLEEKKFGRINCPCYLWGMGLGDRRNFLFYTLVLSELVQVSNYLWLNTKRTFICLAMMKQLVAKVPRDKPEKAR